MKKGIKKIILLSMTAILLTGCEKKIIKADNPLSEDDVIKYVEKEIYNQTYDDVDVKIISKENLSACTATFDGCISYQKVEGGTSYKLEIKSKKNKELVATGTYKDGYIMYDKKNKENSQSHDANFFSDYKELKNFYDVKAELINALEENYFNYHIYNANDKDEVNIFITSKNYDEINNLLSKFKTIVLNARNSKDYHLQYNVYIYKDKIIFNETNFDLNKDKTENYDKGSTKDTLKHYTGKEVEIIGNTDGFDKEAFESNGTTVLNEGVDESNYEYIVLCYKAVPNSFIGYNKPHMQILGVK